MSTSLTRLSRGAIATLTVLLAACSGGGATEGDTDGLDFVPPSIDILTPEDTTTIVDRAQPFAMSVDVADNSELRRVRMELFDGLDRLFSRDTTFLGADIVTRHIMTGTADISDRDVGKLMHMIVTAYDGAGNQFSDSLPFLTTSIGAPPVEVGPTVRLEMPADTIMYPGREVRFRVTALDPDGIAQIADTIRGSGMPTTIQTHDVVTSPLLDSLSIDTVFNIPATTQIGTNIFFVGVARDGRGQFGNAVRRRFIIERQPGDTLGPLVRQTVPVRLEDSASFTVRAEDLGRVRRIGYRVTTSAGVHIDSGSVVRTTTTSTIDTQEFRIRFGPQYRGQTVIVYSFADDTTGNRGYSVATNVTVPQMNVANARLDRPLLVYGRTFALPEGGVGADVAVDSVSSRRIVYVSNFAQNRLEAWNFSNPANITRLSPVLVGSQPWGMALELGGSRLLVANSGGTNLSVVDLTSRTEVDRYRTPNARLWYVKEAANADGTVKYTGEIFDYSDRPQYVAMSQNGNIYFSTRPTSTAPAGTIRRIDPDVPGELQQIWQYGDESPIGEYSVVNADAVTIFVYPAGSDQIEICDHPVGGTVSSICFRGTSVTGLTASIRAAGGDAVAERVAAASLALTDTTFVDVGGDRRWVAFGEGNTEGRPGRIMMVYDPLGSTTLDATPGISVRDLTDNASDRVTGVAINSNSSTVGVHGAEAYFAEVNDDFRFQLRLQGKFATSGSGSGIVFHPLNDGTSSDANTRRIAVVAAGEPKLQIIDTYFFRMRGEIPLQAPLFGPLRAILPTPTEAASGVVMKIFGLSAGGLVIVDVLASDIAP